MSPFAFLSYHIWTIHAIRQELSLTLSQKGRIISQFVFNYLNTQQFLFLLNSSTASQKFRSTNSANESPSMPVSLFPAADGWTPVLMTQLCCTSTSCWGHDGITENDLVFFPVAYMAHDVTFHHSATSQHDITSAFTYQTTCQQFKGNVSVCNPLSEPNCGRLVVDHAYLQKQVIEMIHGSIPRHL